MRNSSLILLGKAFSASVQALKLGHGSTWPGHIALKANPAFIQDLIRTSGVTVILIAGTNGKTTSSRMIRTILEADGKHVIHNESGANLLNGIASEILAASSISGKITADYAVFEVDENSLPQLLKELTPDYILLLNLFRDQLDRYGEVEVIAKKWQAALETLPATTKIIANADDPKVAYLGMQRENSLFFGLEDTRATSSVLDHAADSVYCPKCGNRLTYTSLFYSHMGKWKCTKCRLKRPEINITKDIKISLSGTYNLSNAHGIFVLARELGTQEDVIANSLQTLSPAFGRQEKISIHGKTAQLFLSKNPTGFNESLRTIVAEQANHVMLVLNDRVADGKDVSWIWDIDMEAYLPTFSSITVSGDRAYDMGLRIKYSDKQKEKSEKVSIHENIQHAIREALKKLPEGEILYILPTYTAMLEVRKLLTGKKIL